MKDEGGWSVVTHHPPRLRQTASSAKAALAAVEPAGKRKKKAPRGAFFQTFFSLSSFSMSSRLPTRRSSISLKMR